jgi:hypothetical protein
MEILDRMNENYYDIVVFHYPCQDGLVSAWVATSSRKLDISCINSFFFT